MRGIGRRYIEMQEARKERAENGEAGFTLIELLVVVIIIGVLAAIAIPTFLNQRERAQVATLRSDVRNVVTLNSAATADSSTGLANGTYSASAPITVSGDTFTPSRNVSITVAGSTPSAKTITGTYTGVTGNVVWSASTGAYSGALAP